MKPLPEFQAVEFDERATKADRIAVSYWLTHQRHLELRKARDVARYAANREAFRIANKARRAAKKAER